MLTKRSTLIILALLLAPFVLVGCGSDKTTNPVTQVPDTVPPAAPSLRTPLSDAGLADVRWQKNTEADLAGYNIYEYDPTPDRETSYQRLNTDLVTQINYDVEGLTTGMTYYFKVSAVDESGNESARSTAIAVTVETACPGKDSESIKNDYSE